MWTSPPVCSNGQGLQCCWTGRFCPAHYGPPASSPGQGVKHLHEGGADPGVVQELRTATYLTLRVTKVTARALGQTMSTLVVQERHLWLTLADMRETYKHCFLDSPISQVGLFGEAVEDFAQQFSATEADRGVSTYPALAVCCYLYLAAGCSPSICSSPRAPSTSAPAQPLQQPSQRLQRGAGRRKATQPISAPAKPVKRQGKRHPLCCRLQEPDRDDTQHIARGNKNRVRGTCSVQSIQTVSVPRIVRSKYKCNLKNLIAIKSKQCKINYIYFFIKALAPKH